MEIDKLIIIYIYGDAKGPRIITERILEMYKGPMVRKSDRLKYKKIRKSLHLMIPLRL